MLLFASKHRMMNLFLSEIHRSLKQQTSVWREMTYFRAFYGFFGNERIVILYVCLFFFSKEGADVFCSHGSAAIHILLVMLCQTHGLNQCIHPHTALPTGKYPTVTGFSYYAQSYCTDLSPEALFHSFFFQILPQWKSVFLWSGFCRNAKHFAKAMVLSPPFVPSTRRVQHLLGFLFP